MNEIAITVGKKHPKLAKKALYANSAKAAIRLFCLHCVGDSAKDVKNCTDIECPLWRYRLGGKAVPHISSHLPTEEWFTKEIENKSSKLQKAHAKKLHKFKKDNK